MNVLLVSQCNKNALKETRRILDQFAERRGDRTWQTPITLEGLNTLHRLLRKTARKNTAVACHWIRGRDHSEVLWIVGDARRFNITGASPTNATRRNILRQHDENDWHTGTDISLLAALASLLHDIGKACRAFQDRLKPGAVRERNIYRHEWISLRLFEAFVGSDTDEAWLERLSTSSAADDSAWLERLNRDLPGTPLPSPFASLPPLARAVGWLVVTHHRLPVRPDRRSENHGFRAPMLDDLPGCIGPDWNEASYVNDPGTAAAYWEFPHGLPVTTEEWRKRARKVARRLLERRQRAQVDWLQNPYVLHLARLSLMLADHHYSSLEDPDLRVAGEADYPLIANTQRKTGEPNQTLDEHLIGVEQHSRRVSHALPAFEHQLPRIARHKGLRKRSGSEQYRWQDKAFDLAASLREPSREQGFFGINMASTGCGKTLANGRILYSLADPEAGARFSIALGLRTLTLQTGREYRERLGLSDDDLAVRVGGSATRALFDHFLKHAEETGSESRQSLLDEESYVHYEGDFEQDPLLTRTTHDPKLKALLAAPVLVCTVDHLIPATESQRGGRQIAPMLRLMSADLVLDELDDFDIKDLPALSRLVHWAGMLGTRVLLSSATLPPSLVQGMFEAYRAGRAIYRHNRGEPGQSPEVCCAWFDEHACAHMGCADPEQFAQGHRDFVLRRRERLAKAEVRRRSELAPLVLAVRRPEETRPAFAAEILEHALKLHARHHSTDPVSGKRVSFGLVRMANIGPIVDVALTLYQLGIPSGHWVHLCVYHSQYPLLLRSVIERQLDQALDRRRPDAVFELQDVRQRLDAHVEGDQLFIVLGSPVTEVGRDHDYDWAVVEPSSMRSLIQLAGRVRRHRVGPCDSANIVLLDTNLKHFEQLGSPAFCRPGFEDGGEFSLHSHRLERLLLPEQREVIDARPRISEPPELRPQENLVDLEHVRLRRAMLMPDKSAITATSRRWRRGVSGPAPVAPLWWTSTRAHLTAILQQEQPFRARTERTVDMVLIADEEDEMFHLMRVERAYGRQPTAYVEDDRLMHLMPEAEVTGSRISPWCAQDYRRELALLAEERDMPLISCAQRFGIVSLPESVHGWRFHSALGFTKWK